MSPRTMPTGWALVKDVMATIRWRRELWFWHPLVKPVRYFGFRRIWHDGPIYTFGFWFFNMGVM